MKTIEKCFKVLDKISFILSALCVGGMLICVFLQVVARFFQFSINWTTEMSQYFFLWSTTFASYVAARRGKLIGVELVQKNSRGRYSVCCALLPMVQLHGSIFWSIITVRFSFPN